MIAEQDGARRRWSARLRPGGIEDDCRRTCRRQQRGVARIRNEGEIAWASVLDAGDAQDLDITVTFEATLQPVGNVSQLQLQVAWRPDPHA